MTEKTMTVGEIEIQKAIKSLWYWRKGGDSFSCMLYELVSNSLFSKREKLLKGFPYERRAYTMWLKGKANGSEKEFFESHGLRFDDGK